MFEYDRDGNLVIDGGIYYDQRFSNLEFIRIGMRYFKFHSSNTKTFRSGEEFSKILTYVPGYQPAESATESFSKMDTMLLHAVRREDANLDQQA